MSEKSLDKEKYNTTIIEANVINLRSCLGDIDSRLSKRLDEVDTHLKNIGKKIADINQPIDEKQIVESVIKQNESLVRKTNLRVIGVSIFMLLIISIYVYDNWSTLGAKTSLSFGSLLLTFGGTLFFGIAAFLSISSLAKMSLTYKNANPRLFTELCKTKYTALAGICFVIIGLLLQAGIMVLWKS